MPPKKTKKKEAPSAVQRAGNVIEDPVLRMVEALPREVLNSIVAAAVKEGAVITADQISTNLQVARARGIGELASEILVAIFRYLPIRDRILVVRACRHFRQLSSQGVFDEVRFLKVPTRKELHDPFAWMKKHTVSAFLRSLPNGTVKSLTVHHHTLSPASLASLARNELSALTELNLVGTHFLHKFNGINRISFPSLRKFRVMDYQNHRGNATSAIPQGFVEFLQKHDTLQEIFVELSLAGEAGQALLSGDPSKFALNKSLRVLRAECSISLDQFTNILLTFPNLVELEISGLHLNGHATQQKEVSLPGNGFMTMRIPFLSEERLNELAALRAQKQMARLQKLTIHESAYGYGYGFGDTNCSCHFVGQTVGPSLETLEYFSHRMISSSFVGQFPALRRLRVLQPSVSWYSHNIPSPAKPFAGFDAPGLEELVLFGKMPSWKEEVLRPYLAPEAKVTITRADRKETRLEDKAWLIWL
ncbi:hypothetical protein DFJ74DRAFT_689593 [Hyaloraphidium curvatum]|nr:hypothetical protein DFJ74DRAFT_689593 [Hyaloraphidium curvatum]